MPAKKFFGAKQLGYTKDYGDTLFKDALDIDQEFERAFRGASFISTRRRFQGDTHKIRILSVQFSKVGRTTLEQFPNLRWIQTRSHATHHINFKECANRDVQVIAAHPFAAACSRWLVDKIRALGSGVEPYGYLGWGNIAKTTTEELIALEPLHIWNTTTNRSGREVFLQNTKTCIVTVPLSNKTKQMVTDKFLSSFKQPNPNLIGLSPTGVFQLTQAQHGGTIILDEEHIAWKHPPTAQAHFIAVIKKQIDQLKTKH